MIYNQSSMKQNDMQKTSNYHLLAHDQVLISCQVKFLKKSLSNRTSHNKKKDFFTIITIMSIFEQIVIG